MDKATEVKKCLADLQRLGMDMAGLRACQLSNEENHALNCAFAYIEGIAESLNVISPPPEK